MRKWFPTLKKANGTANLVMTTGPSESFDSDGELITLSNERPPEAWILASVVCFMWHLSKMAVVMSIRQTGGMYAVPLVCRSWRAISDRWRTWWRAGHSSLAWHVCHTSRCFPRTMMMRCNLLAIWVQGTDLARRFQPTGSCVPSHGSPSCNILIFGGVRAMC